MTASVLCIGTELTRGELLNSNATWLADALTAIGFEVGAIDCVDDDRARIERALKRLAGEHELIICTGGLGPTTDDITTECVARVLRVNLVRDEASLSTIRERMARVGRAMAPSNEKQADFPAGAQIIANPNGTAPGFAVTLDKARAFFLPGVPQEMMAMFEASIVPEIMPLLGSRHHQIILRTFGLPESEVNDKLAGIEERYSVTIGYRATLPEIEVKVLARDRNESQAEQAARSAANEVRERLGEIVFSEGKVHFAEALGNLLRERRLRLAVAESCTGGLVGELLTAHAGSSDYFVGGIIAYSNEVKQNLLGVPEALLIEKGAVSAEVAIAMAEGARTRLNADISVAITGIAGPGGGTQDKPVGLVYIAAATASGVTDKRRLLIGNRDQIRRRASFAALNLVRKIVLHGHA